MHRTQLLFHEEHYSALKRLSREEKKSISAILREMIESFLESKKLIMHKKSKILALQGIIKDSKNTSCEVDEILYGGKH